MIELFGNEAVITSSVFPSVQVAVSMIVPSRHELVRDIVQETKANIDCNPA